MGSTVRNLIGFTAGITVLGFFSWYITVHRPSADVNTQTACTEGASCFAGSNLAGSGENLADFDGGNVVIDPALGLRLATLTEEGAVQRDAAADQQATTQESVVLASTEQVQAAIDERLNALAVTCAAIGSSAQPAITRATELDSIILQNAATYRERIMPPAATGFDAELIVGIFRRQQESFDAAVQAAGLDAAALNDAWVFMGIFQKNLAGQAEERGWSITGLINQSGQMVAVQEVPARVCVGF